MLRSKLTQQKKQDWKYHLYSPLDRLKSPKVLPKVSVHWWTLFQTAHLNRSIPWIVPANQAIQISLNEYESFRIIYISIFPIYHLGFHICFLTSSMKCWKNIEPNTNLSSTSLWKTHHVMMIHHWQGSVRPVRNYLFTLSLNDDKLYSYFSTVLSDSTFHIISLGFVFRATGTPFTLLNYWYKWGWFSTLWNFPSIQMFNKFNTSRPVFLASSIQTLYFSYWHQQWYQLFFYEQARKFSFVLM